MLTLNFLLQSSLCFGSPEAAEIRKAIDMFNTSAKHRLPEISDEHLKQLKNGSVVKIIDRNGKDPYRATGLFLVDAPMWETWVAVRDPHFQQQKSTTEKVVARPGPGIEEWYGKIDTPWPVTDRHWLIHAWHNLQLAGYTKNKAWERTWELVEDSQKRIDAYEKKGLLPIEPKDAILTPENKGAWLTIQLEKQTLLGYHVTTSVGGNVPDRLLIEFTSSSYDEMLRTMGHRAEKTIRNHYKGEHEPIIGGDGKKVPRF